MEDVDINVNETSLKPILAGAAQTIALLMGCIYTVGFFVSVIHLGSIGILSVDVIRGHYLLAGVWALMPLVFGSFISVITIKYLYENWGDYFEEKDMSRLKIVIIICLIFITVFISIIIISYPLSLLTTLLPHRIDIPRLGLSIFGFVTAVFVVLIDMLVRSYLAKVKEANAPSDQSDSTNVVAATIVFTNFSLLIILFYIVIFAYFIYPRIPAQIGGGQPIKVQFILGKDSDGLPFIKPSVKRPEYSQPVYLVADLNTDYAIRDEKYRTAERNVTVRFSKALVNGYVIIYQNKQFDSFGSE